MKLSDFFTKIKDLLEDGRLSPNAEVSIKIPVSSFFPLLLGKYPHLDSELVLDLSHFAIEEDRFGLCLSIVPELEHLD